MNRVPSPLESVADRVGSPRSVAASIEVACEHDLEQNGAAPGFRGPASSTSPLLLTFAELVALSGYRRARDQVAWIAEHYGIRAYVNAANEAVVVRAHLEATTQPPVNQRKVRTVREVPR